ncbi:CAP domain-containing protein [Cellulomonas sp.]|uniref:CAP domain-containing protein n=1 Tax=Cellulomonas sp. TaxID=40001 RepID=UPI003BA9F0FC
MAKDTKKLLDLVPSQRPSVISAPVPVVDVPTQVDVPHQRTAPSPLVEETAARIVAVRRSVWVGLAAGVALAVAAGGGVYAADQKAQATQARALEAGLRVDQSVQAAARDAVVARQSDAVVAQAAYVTSRAAATTGAQATVDHANATLAAVPNAGDAPRAALVSATGAVGTAITAPHVSLTSLRSLVAGVAAPEKAAVDAQAAWQAAENARIAAEQAAAAAAAQAAAAARSAKAPTRSAARAAAPRAAAGAAPVAPSAGIPSGGKVCSGSGGSGAGESSVSAIGSAINAYRASLGLSELSVSRSGSLVSHSINMANAGGIWHSGGDNIVACVSNGSASSMVAAWSRSAGHDAQMRRTDVSSMSVGGASLGGWLFGAVKFS